jgi:acetylornithine/succinyldiaminopimelate/putrescine aminotransferase
MLGNDRVANSFQPGDHGTTFGGGPLACRLALEVINVIQEEGLIAKVNEMGGLLVQGIKKLAAKHNLIGEIRGMGLMIGVQIGDDAPELVKRLLKKGFIANAAHDTVLRLLPPFIISSDDISKFLAALDETLSELESEKAK